MAMVIFMRMGSISGRARVNIRKFLPVFVFCYFLVRSWAWVNLGLKLSVDLGL